MTHPHQHTTALRVALALAVAATCSACFTGIESTPRITAGEVRKAGALPSVEEEFATAIVAEAPAAWSAGKRWRVDDGRASMIFDASSGAPTDSLQGSDIVLQAVRRVPGIMGRDVLELEFSTPGRHGSLIYRPDGYADDILNRSDLAIPFCIELSAVEIADSLMRGREIFVTSPLWVDSAGRAEDGLHHIAVTVDSVTAGTWQYPLTVNFHSVEHDRRGRVRMTYGASAGATRNFDRLFTFSDPRKAYPRILPESWDKIIHSKITEGMSRDECRLALGAPSRIDRGSSLSSVLERWTYAEGIYLIFEDGLLVRFRL
ncbi:MAG: hypothetical protein K2M19_05535 [Muribaculaceae bacterium]|nr:hypothetical protein [Muribaculaceae bacterium]